MMLFIPKNDALRHKILGLLRDKANRGVHDNSWYYNSVREIANEMKLSEEDFLLIADGLKWPEEIQYEVIESGQPEIVMQGTETHHAFASRKYLIAGRTRVINRVKNYLGITVSSIAIITAIIAIITTILSLSSNKERIEVLERDMKQLKTHYHLPG